MENNTENAETQLAQQREKLKALLNHENAIASNIVDSKLDLNPHKDWIIKLIKRATKLDSHLEFDFITELVILRKRQS